MRGRGADKGGGGGSKGNDVNTAHIHEIKEENTESRRLKVYQVPFDHNVMKQEIKSQERKFENM